MPGGLWSRRADGWVIPMLTPDAFQAHVICIIRLQVFGILNPNRLVGGWGR